MSIGTVVIELLEFNNKKKKQHGQNGKNTFSCNKDKFLIGTYIVVWFSHNLQI